MAVHVAAKSTRKGAMTGKAWGAWALAAWSAMALSGCVKGVGEPCGQNAECQAGLVCEQSKCATCGDGVACVAVDLVVKACPGAPNPLEGVTDLRFTVVGDDLTPLTGSAKVSDRTLAVPKVPFGKNRRILVEGYESAEASAALKARGVSLAFDVDTNTPVPSLTIFLRRVLAFSSTVDRAGTTCTGLAEPRAGHSATRLQDGRVLIAGGYSLDETGKRVFLNTAEIYDPQSGQFVSTGTKMALPRADHTATLLPNGRVLLAGGRSVINGAETGLAAELYDPQSNQFIFLGRNEQMATPRLRHSAAVLPNGVVLVAGGVSKPSDTVPLDTIEMYDPSRGPNGAFIPVKNGAGQAVRLAKPRADHASVAVGDDSVFLVGGTDGTNALNTVEVWKYLGGTFVPATGASYSLAAGRSNPFAFPVGEGDNQGLLVLGAPASGSQNQNDAWDWIAVPGTKVPGREVTTFPTARKDACAAPFEGGALIAGGRTPQQNSYLKSSDLFVTNPNGKLASLVGPQLSDTRVKAACTTLADGGVLVVGGESKNGGSAMVLGSAEIFQPR